MSKKSLPDNEVKPSALKKRRHRANQKWRRAAIEHWVIKGKKPRPEYLVDLGSNLQMMWPPKNLIDQEDGSLDRDKIMQLSKKGNAGKQEKRDSLRDEVRSDYARVWDRREGTKIIFASLKRKNDPKDVPSLRTVRNWRKR